MDASQCRFGGVPAPAELQELRIYHFRLSAWPQNDTDFVVNAFPYLLELTFMFLRQFESLTFV